MYDSLIFGVVGLPLALLFSFSLICHGKKFNMDSGMGAGSFYGIFAIYRRLAYVIFTVALAIAVLTADKKWPPAMIICGAAAIYAFLFNVWMTFNYEAYLQAKYPFGPDDRTTMDRKPSIYTGGKYAITLALGFSCTILFIAGIIVFLMTLSEA